MNCPNCGAVIKEGKFCNYCGAKLPDSTKHIDVNINKRIENVAEMKRADFEADESNLRQREMKMQINARKTKRYACLLLLFICITLFGIEMFFHPGGGFAWIGMLGFIGGIFLAGWVIYQLVTGKW